MRILSFKNNKIRILFIGSFFGKSRGTISIAEKLKLKFQNHEIYTILLVSRFKNKFFRIIDITTFILFNKYSNTFIDTFSGNSFFIVKIAGKFLRFRGKKYSLIIRGGNFVNYFIENENLVGKELLKANELISPSKFIIDFFDKRGIQIHYLPNYIEQNNFPFNQKRIRKSYSILWVRAFSEIYNPLIPIFIINKLKDKYPDVTLTMVGPDLGLLVQVKKEITKLKLEKHIQIVGSIPNSKLYKYYQSHKLYLNTTSFESFGMALLEAASCGIPIVSTNVGEIPYIYRNGENILLVEDFSINHFISNIESIFTSESLADKLSKNGVELSKQYSFDKIQPIWLKHFEKFQNV